MAMTEIPEMKYQIDGDNITIEQGGIEPAIVGLHRIHLEHLAKEMKIGLSHAKETSPQLVEYLERINEQAQDLYALLAGVPSFPPQNQVSEDVLMAKQLKDTANMALSFWGNN